MLQPSKRGLIAGFGLRPMLSNAISPMHATKTGLIASVP